MSPAAHDWLGKEIVPGTRVLWRNAGWSLGIVLEVHAGGRFLDIAWENREYYAHAGAYGIGKRVSVDYVTVWPVQPEIKWPEMLNGES